MKGKGRSLDGHGYVSDSGSELAHVALEKPSSTLQSSHPSSSQVDMTPCAGGISFETVGKECKRVLEMSRMVSTPCPYTNCKTRYSSTSEPGMKQHLLNIHKSTAVHVRLQKKSAPTGRLGSRFMETFDPGGLCTPYQVQLPSAPSKRVRGHWHASAANCAVHQSTGITVLSYT